MKSRRVLPVVAALLLSHSAFAQVETAAPAPIPGARPAVVERIKIHSKALEGNLERNADDRDVLVVLPPSYRAEPKRRYPVVYALHGYYIGAEQWAKELHVPQTVEGAFARGAQDLIIVLPDSKTVHNGSMYSSSVTTGDFESFVAHDLVSYVDTHYRTIPRRESRGLAGHSMGGYGAMRIGMKHPEIFSSLYILSPCCLSARGAPRAEDESALAAVKSPEDSSKLPFLARSNLAVGAAWSPNPGKPPLYMDLPIGDARQAVLAKWAANAPLAMIDQYVGNLRQYRAIAIDVGDQDGLKMDTERLHQVLDSYGIQNSFEIYPGTHTSHVAYRLQDQLLPFFSKTLSAK